MLFRTRNSPPPRPKAANTDTASLPQRWRRGRQQAAFVALVALLFFTSSFYRQSGADELDSWWLRARFSLREWLHRSSPPTPDPRLVLVDIDDITTEGWKDEPIIYWGDHFADVVNQLNRSGARLIAFDWTQPVATDEKLKWKHDEHWGAALSRAKNVVFVKLLRSTKNEYVLPTPALLYAIRDAYKDGGESSLGYADLVNRDGVQYTYFPEAPPKPDGTKEVSFGQRIVEKSGYDPHLEIPLRPDGSFLINYADGTGTKQSPFERVSFYDVASMKAPDPRFKDKIVFIGASYKGDNDTHTIAFLNGLFGARLINGVEVHMNAVVNMLDGDAIEEPSNGLVWFMAITLGAIGVGVYALQNWGRATLTVATLLLSWVALSFLLFWRADIALPVVFPVLTLLLGSGLMGGYRTVSEERERRQVMKIWGRYQDPRLIQELLEHPDLRSGQGREAEVTVLFADLKNFTKTVESLTPAQALEALNRYLALFARTIREHGGMVDKYLGDGLMAQWGAPIAHPDHATAAVRACLEIERKVADLTQNLNLNGQVSFEVRLTLHTGLVVAGPLGDEEKLEYTLIGDTVNVTSRLQETAKALGCDFLISETTRGAMRGRVETGRETEVMIRGRRAPLRVFEVLAKGIAPLDETRGAASGESQDESQNEISGSSENLKPDGETTAKTFLT